MDFDRLLRMSHSYVEARCLHTAVELGLVTALAADPSDAPSVAQRCGTHPGHTEVFLDALVALRLVRKHEDRYELANGVADLLVPGGAQYCGNLIKFVSSGWDSWTRLPEVIRSGRPARDADMFQSNPEMHEHFIRAMDDLVSARGDVDELVKRVDWSRVRRMLDVGSGPATFPIGCCRHAEHLEATALDLPATLEITREVVDAAGLSQRIGLLAADYRSDAIEGSYDLVLLSNIIHAETAEVNAGLLKKLVGCLEPGGELIVKDHILEEDRTSPPNAAVFSVTMLMFTEGRDYTYEEVAGWLRDVGLVDVRLEPFGTPPHSALVRGRRP